MRYIVSLILHFFFSSGTLSLSLFVFLSRVEVVRQNFHLLSFQRYGLRSADVRLKMFRILRNILLFLLSNEKKEGKCCIWRVNRTVNRVHRRGIKWGTPTTAWLTLRLCRRTRHKDTVKPYVLRAFSVVQHIGSFDPVAPRIKRSLRPATYYEASARILATSTNINVDRKKKKRMHDLVAPVT